MGQMTEQELRKKITAGDFAPLYMLTGEEKLTLKRAAGKLMEKAGELFPDFNRARFTNDSDPEDIAAAVEALPFMAGHKCVAVADFDPDSKAEGDLERVLSLMDDLPETCTLVFYYPTTDVPKRKGRKDLSKKWKRFLEKVDKAGYTVDFMRLGAGELYRLLEKEAGRQGCTLPRRSWERLFGYAGSDLRTLRGELEKLCAYALGAGQGEITSQMVEELTPKSTETTVFAIARAMASGRYDEAYRQLDMLFSRGEPPVAVLGSIASAYVDMYRVKAALESGLTGGAPAEYDVQYKGRDFRLQNAQRSVRGLSLRTLGRCLELILEADMSLKGSKLPPRLVLEGLISKLILAVRE